MSTMVAKALGAAVFSPESWQGDIESIEDHSAVVFIDECLPIASEWESQIQRLQGFRLLKDDWDGEGSPAPDPEIVDGAIAFAQQLQRQTMLPPDRVVVGMNGTIFFEWHHPEGYYELEVASPVEVETRWIPKNSDAIVVSRFGRK